MLNISTPKLIFFNKKKPTSSSVFNSDQLEKENTLQAFLVGKIDQMQMWKVAVQTDGDLRPLHLFPAGVCGRNDRTEDSDEAQLINV